MTNQQAIAYTILALDFKGYKKEDIREIESLMNMLMDMRTEEEVERLAENIIYNF